MRQIEIILGGDNHVGACALAGPGDARERSHLLAIHLPAGAYDRRSVGAVLTVTPVRYQAGVNPCSGAGEAR